MKRKPIILPQMGLNKREMIYAKFSKSGVDQEWRLFFHSGRLLTDEVFTNWNKATHLRSVEKCRTIDDVYNFLKTYSYHERFISFSKILNLDECGGNKIRIKQIIDLKINPHKLVGTLHWGEFTIDFIDDHVTFTMFPKYNFGTHKITGVRDLIKLTEKTIGRMDSHYEYAKKLKTIEVL